MPAILTQPAEKTQDKALAVLTLNDIDAEIAVINAQLVSIHTQARGLRDNLVALNRNKAIYEQSLVDIAKAGK